MGSNSNPTSFTSMSLHKALASLKLMLLVCKLGVLTVPPSSLVRIARQGKGRIEWWHRVKAPISHCYVFPSTCPPRFPVSVLCPLGLSQKVFVLSNTHTFFRVSATISTSISPHAPGQATISFLPNQVIPIPTGLFLFFQEESVLSHALHFNNVYGHCSLWSV